MKRENLVVAGFGRKGSGKSKLLHDLFTGRAPRLLTVDPNGEAPEQNPNAILCLGWGQLMDALSKAAHYDRWHIAAALEGEELAELARLLAPKLGQGASLSRAFGGIALECGEVQELAPNAGTAPAIKGLWSRGRHHLLSLFMATQRPALCDRLVSSMADVLFVFGQTDPRDVEYIERELGRAIAEEVRRLPLYHFVYFTRADGIAYLCDDQRRPYRIFNTFGEETTCTPSPLTSPTGTPRSPSPSISSPPRLTSRSAPPPTHSGNPPSASVTPSPDGSPVNP